MLRCLPPGLDPSLSHPFLSDRYLFTRYPPHAEGFPGGASGKEPTCQCGRPGFHPWVGKIPWRRAWQPTAVFLPGESRGRRSLVGCHPWGRKSWTGQHTPCTGTVLETRAKCDGEQTGYSPDVTYNSLGSWTLRIYSSKGT